MARFINEACKKSRRVGFDLDLKSRLGKPIKEKCKINVVPGQHGLRKKKVSDYSLQLTAKQTIKFMYGIFEKQFKTYFKKAYKKKGSTGLNLLELVESRLDNVVYRMGFACTRAEARQMVSHRAILVKKDGVAAACVVNIPSYLVKPNDVIVVSNKASKQERVKNSLDFSVKTGFVDWVSVDSEKKFGIFKRIPKRSEMSSFINERLVVEFYSK